MVAHINAVAFQGIEALDVDVQVSISSGLPSFTSEGMQGVRQPANIFVIFQNKKMIALLRQ